MTESDDPAKTSSEIRDAAHKKTDNDIALHPHRETDEVPLLNVFHIPGVEFINVVATLDELSRQGER